MQTGKLILRDAKAAARSENCAKAGKEARLLRGAEGFRDVRESDVKKEHVSHPHSNARTLPFRHH